MGRNEPSSGHPQWPHSARGPVQASSGKASSRGNVVQQERAGDAIGFVDVASTTFAVEPLSASTMFEFTNGIRPASTASRPPGVEAGAVIKIDQSKAWCGDKLGKLAPDVAAEANVADYSMHTNLPHSELIAV